MGKYIDGFVLVVPKGKEAEYQKMAEEGRDSWMKHGALGYFECRGEDLTQQDMGGKKSRSFREMTGATDDENVWFSLIMFKSRQHRDEVNKKVIEEMEQSSSDYNEFAMPFNMQQMAYGGFEVAVEADSLSA